MALKTNRIVSDSLTEMGFKLYLKKEVQGCIITTFYNPKDENYNFDSKIMVARNRVLRYVGKEEVVYLPRKNN